MLNARRHSDRLRGWLRDRPWLSFLTTQGLSTIGSWATRVAMSWLVLRLGDSVFYLGLFAFAGQAPVIFLAPLAGRLLDRVPRRHVLLITQSLSLGQAFALYFLCQRSLLSIPILLPLTLIHGAIQAFALPARQAYLGDLAPRPAECAKAQALDGAQVNVGRLLGPAVAALLIPRFGEQACFLLDGITYLVALVGLVWLPAAAHQPNAASAADPHCNGDRSFRQALCLLAATSLFLVPFTVLLPQYVRTDLEGGPDILGTMTGLSGGGAIAAAILLYLAGRRIVCLAFNTAACTGGACCLLTLPHSGSPEWSGVVVFFASFFIMLQISTTAAMAQSAAGPARRGRCAGLYGVLFWGIVPTGSLLQGILAARLGIEPTMSITAGSCLLATGAITLFPLFLKLKNLHDKKYLKYKNNIKSHDRVFYLSANGWGGDDADKKNGNQKAVSIGR